MKIQLASDLHLEFLQERWPGERLITQVPDADLLVLAGDIANGTQAIELFADWPVPVLYLAGNHEFYGESMDETRRQLRIGATGTPIHFLDNDRVDIQGVRFLGCTLWTDYQLDARYAQAEQMKRAEQSLNDHWSIRTQEGLLSAARALQEHEQSRAWLQRELAKPFAGPTVVVTHHGPHPGSVHPRYAGNPLNSAFVSDLSFLMPSVDLWLHGHVHDSVEYWAAGCRVVANPRGYARNYSSAATPDELQFENPHFDGSLLLDLVQLKDQHLIKVA